MSISFGDGFILAGNKSIPNKRESSNIVNSERQLLRISMEERYQIANGKW